MGGFGGGPRGAAEGVLSQGQGPAPQEATLPGGKMTLPWELGRQAHPWEPVTSPGLPSATTSLRGYTAPPVAAPPRRLGGLGLFLEYFQFTPK